MKGASTPGNYRRRVAGGLMLFSPERFVVPVPCATLLHACGRLNSKWDTNWLTVDEAAIQFHRRTWRVGGSRRDPENQSCQALSSF